MMMIEEAGRRGCFAYMHPGVLVFASRSAAWGAGPVACPIQWRALSAVVGAWMRDVVDQLFWALYGLDCLGNASTAHGI